jgi:hypothetical protein
VDNSRPVPPIITSEHVNAKDGSHAATTIHNPYRQEGKTAFYLKGGLADLSPVNPVTREANT